MEEKTEVLEIWIYRRIEQTPWAEKKTNKDLLGNLKLTRELMKNIITRQIKYFSHIKRYNRIFKKAYFKKKS